MDGVIGAVVHNRLATFHELETVYSYSDALDMMEIIRVNNYNEWVVSSEINKGGRHGR